MGLRVVALTDYADERIGVLKKSCENFGLTLEVVQYGKKWVANAIKLKLLYDYGQSGNAPDDELLLVVDAFDTEINATAEEITRAFKELGGDIIFSAEANYYFREPDLSYYYWKLYPRGSTTYDYLNSGSFICTAAHLRHLLSDMQALYRLDFTNENSLQSLRSDQYIFSRFFVDCTTGFFQPDYTIDLDRKQTLFACSGGRVAVAKWPLASKRHSFLFFQYERKLLKTFGLASTQTSFRDLKWKKGKYFNSATGTSPLVIHLPASGKKFSKRLGRLKTTSPFHSPNLLKIPAVLLSFFAWVQSLVNLQRINIYNKGKSTQAQVFRYSKNQGSGYHDSARRLADLLLRQVPFSFSHVNDGEMTFIKKYLNRDNEAKWYGRKQQIYSEKLAQLLMGALQKRINNYFVGIPCGTCYPELRKLAEQLRPADRFTVPAMAIHHNLSVLPAILGGLRGKTLYFVLNEDQDLTVLKKLGLEVAEERITRVPFKNSYLLYDDLCDKKFESGAAVLMMCGMLAKILSPVWFENNPTCTFIAFGSSIDDFIQKGNVKFKLFPAQFPFTRNIYPYRSFLFGLKKPCPECFRLEDPSPDKLTTSSS